MILFLLSLVALMGGSVASPALAPSALAVFSVFVPSFFVSSVLAVPAHSLVGFSLSPREANALHAITSSPAPISSVLPVSSLFLSQREADASPIPISSALPVAPVSPSAPAALRPITHGTCDIHIRQIFGNPNGKVTGNPRAGNITAYILDAGRYEIGFLLPTRFNYGLKNGTPEVDTVEFSSRLPQVMTLKLEGLGSIKDHGGKDMKVHFSIGDDQW